MFCNQGYVSVVWLVELISCASSPWANYCKDFDKNYDALGEAVLTVASTLHKVEVEYRDKTVSQLRFEAKFHQVKLQQKTRRNDIFGLLVYGVCKKCRDGLLPKKTPAVEPKGAGKRKIPWKHEQASALMAVQAPSTSSGPSEHTSKVEKKAMSGSSKDTPSAKENKKSESKKGTPSSKETEQEGMSGASKDTPSSKEKEEGMSGSSKDTPSSSKEKEEAATNMSLTAYFAQETPDLAMVPSHSQQLSTKERYMNGDLIVPGIALKKMAMCLADEGQEASTHLLAILGVDKIKQYRTERPCLKGMVIGSMNSAEELWKAASGHLRAVRVGALFVFSNFALPIEEAS